MRVFNLIRQGRLCDGRVWFGMVGSGLILEGWVRYGRAGFGIGKVACVMGRAGFDMNLYGSIRTTDGFENLCRRTSGRVSGAYGLVIIQRQRL